jgi:hypothetical protein
MNLHVCLFLMIVIVWCTAYAYERATYTDTRFMWMRVPIVITGLILFIEVWRWTAS